MYRSISVVLAATALAACSPMPTQALREVEPSETASITVYRVHAFNAGGVSLAVGANGAAFASLGNDEYVTANLSAGQQVIFVKASSGSPTSLNLTLKAGERICLKTEADSINLAKVAIPPLLMFSGYSFTLEQVGCPSIDEIGKYKQVAVTYRSES